MDWKYLYNKSTQIISFKIIFLNNNNNNNNNDNNDNDNNNNNDNTC